MERLDGAAKVLVVAAKNPLFPEVVGNAVAVSSRLVSDDLFTTTPVFRVQCSFRHWREGREELSRDIPGLPTDKAANMCAALDCRGIIKCGSAVKYGDILVGKVAPVNPRDYTEEEKILQRIFERMEEGRKDASLYYRFRDPGVVCNVEVLAWQRYRCASCGDIPWHDSSLRKCPFCSGPLTDRQSDDAPPGVMYVVRVDVIIRRKLSVGDVLRDGKGNECTVARIVQRWDMPHFRGEDVDVLVAADSSIASHLHREGTLRKQRKWHKTHGDRLRLEKVTIQSSEKMVYRGLGPASKFTDLPISSDTVFPGQKVSEAVLKSLLRDGYVSSVRELLSIKADSAEGKTAAYEALVKGEPVPFGVPETTNRFWALLKALCFAPRLLDEGGSEVKVSADAGSATSLVIQGMNTSDVRAESYGQVKNPETYNCRSYRAGKNGLFCERIFGPERDWECFCGKYRGSKYKGTLCDRCGAKVAHSRVRRKRFGHIELAMPVIHPWYLKTVAAVLGLPQKVVQDVLSYSQELDAPLAVRNGPLAVKEYLEQKGTNTNCVFLEAIPVLPAGLRPTVLAEDGNWWCYDCTDLYRRVINRNNRLQKLVQLDAPLVIIQNEHRMLQNNVAALFLNEMVARPVVNEHDAPLHSLRWELTHLLKELMDKRVDYSARLVASPNAELQRSTVGVPAKVLDDLYQPLVIRELKGRGFADTIKSAQKMIERDAEGAVVREALTVAMHNRPMLIVTEGQKVGAFQPVVKDGETLHLHPDDASRLSVRFAGERVTLHLPLTDAAVAEMREPRPLEDTSSLLLDLNLDNLPEVVWNQASLVLKPLDRIVLGIGQ